MLHSHQKRERLMYDALVTVADKMDRSNAVCSRIEHLLGRVLRVDPHVADHYGVNTLQNDINQALQHISVSLNALGVNTMNMNSDVGTRNSGDGGKDRGKEEKIVAKSSSTNYMYDGAAEVATYSPRSVSNTAGPKVTYLCNYY